MASHRKSFDFRIIGGPSKFDLMVSLFEGNPENRTVVAFKLGGLRQDINVAITGIRQEDGSGESWIFEGWVVGEPSAQVKGHYGSRLRGGIFNFLVPIIGRLEDGNVIGTIDEAEEKKISDALDKLRENLNRDFSRVIQNARRM